MAAVVSDDSGKGRGSAARAPKDEGPGVGEILRAARERRGLTLEQIARETKIPLRLLDALEHDNLAALPGPFYQRAEIRTYARAVNLDPNLVMARLERKSTPAVQPTTVAQPPDFHKPTRSRNQFALIVAGVGLTALVLWRVIPPRPWLGGQTQVGRPDDATAPTMSPEATLTHAAVAIHPAEFEPASSPAASIERVPSAGSEPSVSQSEAATGNLPITKPADERVPVGAATELSVASEPAGARVTVDGIGWGLTPVTIRHLAPGTKRIRVSKDGYATIERVVSIAEGQRKTADIPLPAEP